MHWKTNCKLFAIGRAAAILPASLSRAGVSWISIAMGLEMAMATAIKVFLLGLLALAGSVARSIAVLAAQSAQVLPACSGDASSRESPRPFSLLVMVPFNL
jgi:hypothetical protein